MSDLVEDLRRYGEALEAELFPAVEIPSPYVEGIAIPKSGPGIRRAVVGIAAAFVVLVAIGVAVVLARRSGTV